MIQMPIDIPLVTKVEHEELKQSTEEKFDHLTEIVISGQERMQNEMDQGFAKMDRGFVQVDRRFNVIEKRLDNLESGVQSIIKHLGIKE